MKKAILATLVLVALAFAVPAQAGPIYDGANAIVRHNGVYLHEITVNPAPGESFDPFVTFCLQTNEYLESLTYTYQVAISTYAELEPDSPGNKDPLDPRSAKIYANYSGNYGMPAWTGTEQGGRRSGSHLVHRERSSAQLPRGERTVSGEHLGWQSG